MKVYVYNENCTSAGRVSADDNTTDEDRDDNGDLSLYGEGSEAELIASALASLATRYDRRPGGAGDSFRWKCDRNVLRYLGGPTVEFDEKTTTYLPVDKEQAEDDEEIGETIVADEHLADDRENQPNPIRE